MNTSGQKGDTVRGEPAYRVDATSNYNNETFAEWVIVSGLTKSQADRISDILNEGPMDDPVWYEARAHGHRLWRGMEDLV